MVASVDAIIIAVATAVAITNSYLMVVVVIIIRSAVMTVEDHSNLNFTSDLII